MDGSRMWRIFQLYGQVLDWDAQNTNRIQSILGEGGWNAKFAWFKKQKSPFSP